MPTHEWINQFRARLRTAEKKNQHKDFHVVSDTQDRIFVTFGARGYLVFISQGFRGITLSSIKRRIANWPNFKKRPIVGYILLNLYGGLSPQLASGTILTSKMVAVVGRWGRGNELAVSEADSYMIQILTLAGVPKLAIDRITPRGESEHASGKKPTPAAQPSTGPPVWIRSLRRGMRLDAYELENRLGRGHSAEVWRARVAKSIVGVDLTPGMTVAVKVYSPALLQGTQPLRIQREFSVAADLMHENLAKVYDLVLSPSRPFHTFMVMEYVDGPSLKNFIQQKGGLNIPTVLVIARQLFSALAELHSVGAVHRDVKAANIMLTAYEQPDPIIKLVDLGIVSVLTDDRFTAGSMFLGSKHSAPLEQLTGGELDERTDIYGAGTVLYHCLRGRAMYQDVGPEGAIVRTMLSTPERLPTDLMERMSPDRLLSDFINRCISVEAKNRPATAVGCIDEITEIEKSA